MRSPRFARTSGLVVRRGSARSTPRRARRRVTGGLRLLCGGPSSGWSARLIRTANCSWVLAVLAVHQAAAASPPCPRQVDDASSALALKSPISLTPAPGSAQRLENLGTSRAPGRCADRSRVRSCRWPRDPHGPNAITVIGDRAPRCDGRHLLSRPAASRIGLR